MTRAALTEAQVRRAVKGALEAGFVVGAIDILPDGTIRLLQEKPKPVQPDPRKPEAW